MDLQLTCVDPFWHPERVWSWSKQISKLVAWEKKADISRRPDWPFPLPHPFTPLQHAIPGTSPEIPDQTSALVFVENLLHPSLFFYDISTIPVARFCTRSIFVFNECWFGDHTDWCLTSTINLYPPWSKDVRFCFCKKSSMIRGSDLGHVNLWET